jgi:hypothetical protein
MFKFIKIILTIIIGIPMLLAIIIFGLPICILSSNDIGDLKHQYKNLIDLIYDDIFKNKW